MGTALAMAKGTASVGSAGRADKATIAASEALGPLAYGRAGGEGKCKKPPQGDAWHWVNAPLQEGKRVPVELDMTLRGALTSWGPQKEGPVRTQK